MHLPWSPNLINDDREIEHVRCLLNTPLVVTEKMDGSNVCLESERCFARSHQGPPRHPSFNAFKSVHASIRHLIPENCQVFGEWCYAKHSIKYHGLPHHLMLFGIRNTETNEWSDWSKVEEMAIDMGVATVPLLERGITVINESQLKQLTNDLGDQGSKYGNREGVVVRRQYRFDDDKFSLYVGKWVRKGHVAIDQHWTKQEIEVNGLK